jgi:hypothetical protein
MEEKDWQSLIQGMHLPIHLARYWLNIRAYVLLATSVATGGKLNSSFPLMRANIVHTPSLLRPLAMECLAPLGTEIPFSYLMLVFPPLLP